MEVPGRGMDANFVSLFLRERRCHRVFPYRIGEVASEVRPSKTRRGPTRLQRQQEQQQQDRSWTAERTQPTLANIALKSDGCCFCPFCLRGYMKTTMGAMDFFFLTCAGVSVYLSL